MDRIKPSAVYEHASSVVDRRIYIRWIITASVCLLLLALLFVLWTEPEAAGTHTTSLSYHPAGCRAFSTLLNRLGFTVTKLVTSYGDLPEPDAHVLLVLSPDLEKTLSGGEPAAVLKQVGRHLDRWVRRGGRMVYAGNTNRIYSFLGVEMDIPEGTPLPGKEDLFDRSLEGFSGRRYYFPPDMRPPGAVRMKGYHGGVHGETPFSHASKWRRLPDPLLLTPFNKYFTKDGMLPFFPDESPEPFEVLARLNGRPVALTADCGEGALTVLSTAFPFSNLGLQFAGTGAFAAQLMEHVTENRRRTVVFDEYTHGIIKRRGYLGWVTQTALFYPAVTLLLLAGFLLWRNVVPLGPPEEKRTLPRRAREEYVVTLADIYHKTGRYNTAAELIFRGHVAQLSRLRGTGMQETERFLLERYPRLKQAADRIHKQSVSSPALLGKTVSTIEREVQQLSCKEDPIKGKRR